ncbi:MAG TPA: arginine decarboxylase, pyruvoyl-dependent [Candidatus Bathyarchaeia archaeon]|nr:arginine decarboxylase, pyruvoyl-dependent [Candidatus Bathyarchaeia archaeon]
MIPRSFFLTKGVGKHKEQLASFELALRDAGIAICNIVTVSSIIPPGCRLIPREKGVQMLHPGEITFVVLARNSTDEPHRLIASSIGVAIPSEEQQYGYLSEHHSFGQTEETAGDYCEDLAATMLATTMGFAFDPATAWDDRKQLFKSSGVTIKTTNVTQSAIGDKDGLWTSVIAAAVFLPDVPVQQPGSQMTNSSAV